MGTILILVVLALLGLGVYHLIRNSGKGSTSPGSPGGGTANPSTPTAPAEPPVLGQARRILTSILPDLNLRVRLARLDARVTEAIEGVIDDLRRLVPVMAEKHGTNDLTWDVTRSAEEYLPNLVTTFIGLDATQRAENTDAVLKNLTGLKKNLRKISEFEKQGNFMNFRMEDRFLTAKLNLG